MKRIHFEHEVPAQVGAIPQHIAMTILEAIHRYAETGAGRVKPLSGEFEGFLRLGVGTTASSSRKLPTPSPSTASATAETLTGEGSSLRRTVPAAARPGSATPAT